MFSTRQDFGLKLSKILISAVYLLSATVVVGLTIFSTVLQAFIELLYDESSDYPWKHHMLCVHIGWWECTGIERSKFLNIYAHFISYIEGLYIICS